MEDGALVLRAYASGWFEDMQAGHLTRHRLPGRRAPVRGEDDDRFPVDLMIRDASTVYAGGRTRTVDLRIARQGELFTLLARIEGEAAGTPVEQFIRPDLPETLAVGLTACSEWSAAAALPGRRASATSSSTTRGRRGARRPPGLAPVATRPGAVRRRS